ncbi:DUF177 domain-containing protein [Brumimicrobium glaciale]|jgi:uncharacterized metal-binding protein YceD (DUF177 family)|uniref:DUF177 domain-containing protein n=1 Tax=Brumimicrobium glaciale TaxID=200475 RepID=A0A4Q4KLL3_9FLAO|nr:DUF177 domain-containing protein [Brumimicrobium glaciale]RYM34185.1 DUF177 domain-containing protein [Brumimicrobium glaciale]
MASNKEFIIPFEGLKNGKHSFEFEITTAFFEELAYSIILGGDVKVDFQLNKKDTMLIGDFEMSGTIQKSCDRCTDLMDVPVEVSHQIIYKFGEEESVDENLIVLPISAFTIDLASTLYELLTVALPSRTVHEEDDCNEEMLDLIDKYVDSSEPDEDDSDEEDDTDPRWDALRNLN